VDFHLPTALAAVRERAAARDKVRKGRGPTLVILTHDNPDPDSIAAALGLRRIFEREGIKTTLALGGIIGRAENRAMVRELNIELVPFERLDLGSTPAEAPLFALVDTQPRTGNNSLPDNIEADIVVDHHPQRGEAPHAAWWDIRPHAGATATLVYGYLRSLDIAIDPTLATAFLYALKSETRDLTREAGDEERQAFLELFPKADLQRLQAIAAPKVGREHFVAVDRALRNAMCWGDLVTVNLGALDFPDLVAEVADLLLPYERARWVVCVGHHDGVVYISVRTDQEHAKAGSMIRRVVGARGAAGGHGMIAGGRMYAEVTDESQLKHVYDELVARFRAELHNTTEEPTPLV
jgi:nanoRNase/pAp phosphatase (c-di-AMP/oligoRNAs hydrolase)